MFIKNYLLPKSRLTAVFLDETLDSATKKLNEGNFLSLPVFDTPEMDNFVGILMKEAIYRAYFEGENMSREDFLKKTVREIYSDQFEKIHENDPIEKASSLLGSIGTPFLPVFNWEETFVGIVTHYALFNAYTVLFGLGKGERIVVTIFDIPGQLARLTNVIQKAGVNIVSLVLDDPEILDIQQVFLTVETSDLNALIEKLTAEGFRVGRLNKTV